MWSLYLWAICTINQPCLLETSLILSPAEGIVYTWDAKEQARVVHISNEPVDQQTYIWSTPGSKWVLVLVKMPNGNFGAGQIGRVDVIAPAIYLPMILKCPTGK